MNFATTINNSSNFTNSTTNIVQVKKNYKSLLIRNALANACEVDPSTVFTSQHLSLSEFFFTACLVVVALTGVSAFWSTIKYIFTKTTIGKVVVDRGIQLKKCISSFTLKKKNDAPEKEIKLVQREEKKHRRHTIGNNHTKQIRRGSSDTTQNLPKKQHRKSAPDMLNSSHKRTFEQKIKKRYKR